MRIALIIGFVFFFTEVGIGQDPAPRDTLQVRPSKVVGSTVQGQLTSDSLRSATRIQQKRPVFAIYPVEMPQIPGSRVILTDSTVRWMQWLEYQEFLAGESGTVSFRLGSTGRTDHLVKSGLAGTQLEFRLEGMDWRNPVTGQARFGDVPLERLGSVSEREQGARLIHEASLFSIYSPKPITRVSYNQTAFELRNTDARLSRMIDHRSGFDLIYQGKNNASEYRRMGTESRQTGVRYFRQLNADWFSQALILYTGSEHQESDGYLLPSLAEFNFGRFFANPVRQSATARIRSTQALISLSRVRPDEQAKVNRTKTRLFTYYDRFKRQFSDTDIDLGYDIHQINAGAEQIMEFGLVQLGTSAKVYTTFTGGRSDLALNTWSGYRAESYANINLLPGFRFPAGIRLDGRSDGHHTMGLDAGIGWAPVESVFISVNHTFGAQMPEIGAKYFTDYINRDDKLKSITYERSSIELKLGKKEHGFRIQAAGSLTSMDNFTMLGLDSDYQQVDGIKFLNVSAGLTWNHPNWEVSTTGILLDHNASGESQPALLTVTTAHWKGYVLSNAAYIRVGLTGTTSFLSMKTPYYHAVLDDWSYLSPYDPIPAYSRLDIDLSARVRSLILLFKYENVLQNVGQAGYYETAPYPMPSRRLRFGLRVVFIN